jgi:acetolactate synthase-1/3 small subunit
MTVVVDLKTKSLEQVVKQLNKLINIIKVVELDNDAIERELALIKVRARGDDRARIIEIADIFRARISGVSRGTITVEATGSADKLAALQDLLAEYGIVEMARTGVVALGRDDRGIKERMLRAASDE